MKNILVVPHIGLSGGAGLYIKQILSEIKGEFNISFTGRYANDYDSSSPNCVDNQIADIIFPYYEGVSSKATVYYFFLSMYKLIKVFLSKKTVKRYDAILLTSGIQMLVILLVPYVFKQAKVIILIQENWRLDGWIFGAISRYLCSRSDLVVSITKSWSDKAERAGIESYVYRNMYAMPENVSADSFNEKKFDFVYFGGDQKIKGFEQLVEFCYRLSRLRSIRVGILGELSKDSINKLKSSVNSYNGSEVVFFGFLDDTSHVLKVSKILLLPITAPHFCRPAIEAGFFRIPFLIPNYPGISDFAKDKFNCSMYGSTDEMITSALKILDDSECLNKLGSNNYILSRDFVYSANSGVKLLEAIKGALNEN